ncbi:PspA/IM30 family protein [Thermoleptolyngbya sp. C42_A2020_037]|uniref:PspA/IM30 family protein n=1 Tax=Thermoleptolyngbya sp. C42_A2020_037 TaxID=2747799 RepID=UPI0019D91591|nr:PspA/IM30 family protein [Thermoleptolyngbya sp. C42_A2020_037]MBF2085549.1 PspA/IM30 family protein [Thermoleptolyngbya sp. C42_A2020_037]
MGLLDRIWRVIRANLNSLISQAEDPEKILEQTVIDMQEDLIRLRQAVAQAIATQKRTERQQTQAEAQSREWYQRAQLALQKGEEALAREALTRRKTYQDTAEALKGQIEQQAGIVAQMKKNMIMLESKLAEAKTKKDLYIARARSAKASERLNEMIGKYNPEGALAAFERMEQKVLDLEARSEAIAELNADKLEERFAQIESGDDIDSELAAMKAELIGKPAHELASGEPARQLPEADDLTRLRSQLEES